MKFQGSRGQIVAVYAIALPVLLGFLALALDGGKLWVTKVQLQNAVDAVTGAITGATRQPRAALDGTGTCVVQLCPRPACGSP